MLKVMVTGLFNRGQQEEYVELEAAARCSLEAPIVTIYFSTLPTKK